MITKQKPLPRLLKDALIVISFLIAVSVIVEVGGIEKQGATNE